MMSSQLNQHLIELRQQEIAAKAACVHARRPQDVDSDPRPTSRRRALRLVLVPQLRRA